MADDEANTWCSTWRGWPGLARRGDRERVEDALSAYMNMSWTRSGPPWRFSSIGHCTPRSFLTSGEQSTKPERGRKVSTQSTPCPLQQLDALDEAGRSRVPWRVRLPEAMTLTLHHRRGRHGRILVSLCDR